MRRLFSPGKLLLAGGLLAVITLGVLWLAPSGDYLLLPGRGSSGRAARHRGEAEARRRQGRDLLRRPPPAAGDAAREHVPEHPRRRDARTRGSREPARDRGVRQAAGRPRPDGALAGDRRGRRAGRAGLRREGARERRVHRERVQRSPRAGQGRARRGDRGRRRQARSLDASISSGSSARGRREPRSRSRCAARTAAGTCA